MKTKRYSKKQMFGLLLLPLLVCSLADGITPVSAIAAGGTVSNTTITTGYTLTGTESLTVTNTGKIILTGESDTAITIDSLATGVTVANSGEIIADFGYSAIFIDPAADNTTITNQFGALMSAPAGSAIAYGGLLSGELTNHGEILAGGSSVNFAAGVTVGTDLDGVLDNSGAIAAIADTSAILALATGIYAGGTLTGILDNSGTISASATASGSASLTAISATAYGVAITGALDGTLTNTSTGTISAAATAYNGSDTAHAYAFGVTLGTLAETLENQGLISASASASAVRGATASAWGLMTTTLAGELTNSGTISSTAEAYSDDYDMLAKARGVVIGEFTTWGDYLPGELSGTLTNTSSGTIEAVATVDSDQDSTATVYAYGLKLANISGTGSLDNQGTIRATATTVVDAPEYDAAYAYAVDMTTLEEAGTFTNGGLLEAIATATNLGSDAKASAFAVRLGGGLDGTLTNSGTITASALADAGDSGELYSWSKGEAYAYGVKLNDVAGSFINSNTIEVNAEATGSASRLTAKAYGVNLGILDNILTNSGTIEVSAGAFSYLSAEGEHPDVSATAYGIKLGALDGTLTNTSTGIISVRAEGVIDIPGTYASAEAYGIDVNGTLSGKLDNAGSIGADAIVWDYTSFDRATAYGVRITGSLTGTLDNSGTISATADGSGGSSVDANAHGVYLGGDITASGVFDNSGTISAIAVGRAGTEDATVDVYGIRVVGDLAGELTNSGSISASGEASSTDYSADAQVYGIDVNGSLTGTLTNTNSGTISAVANVDGTTTYVFAAGVRIGTLNGDLVNSGTIQGSASQLEDGYSLWINTGTGLVDNHLGGLLRGNLQVGGAVTVNNAGTISLPATLYGDDGFGAGAYIQSNYTQTVDGVLAIDALDADGIDTDYYGQLNLSGPATFEDGTTVHVNVIPEGSVVGGQLLDDVVVAGGDQLADVLLNVTDSSALLEFTAQLDEDGYLDLNVANVTIADAAGGDLPKSAYGAAGLLSGMLEGFPTGSGLDDFLTLLRGYSDGDDVARAVTETLPSLSVEIPQVALGIVRDNARILHARQQGTRGINSGDTLASNGNAWGKLYTSDADQDSDSNDDFGYDADTDGIILGIDTGVGSMSRFGAALSYAQTDVDGDTWAKQTADIDSYLFMLYGSVGLDQGMNLGWRAGFGKSDTDTTRHLPSVGAVAKGSFDTAVYTFGVDIDRAYLLGENTTFIPSARIDYAMADSESYREKGAGSVSLYVDDNDVDELIFGVDGKISHGFSDSVALNVDAGVGYDALADEGSVNSAYAGAPGLVFKTPGTDVGEFVYRGGLGLVIGAEEGLQVSARYDVEGREDFLNQSLSLKLNLPF